LKNNRNDAELPISSFALVDPSYAAFMKNFKSFAILLAFPLLLNLMGSDPKGGPVNGPFLDRPLESAQDILIFLGILVIVGLVFLFVSLRIGIMLTKLELEAAKGKVVSVSELWESTKERFWPFVGLCVVLGLYIAAGLMLFIVPGVILIRRFIFAPFIFLENKNMTINAALKKSADMSREYSGYIWGVLGVTFLFYLSGLTPVIGTLLSFALVSMYSIALPLRYLEIKKLLK